MPDYARINLIVDIINTKKEHDRDEIISLYKEEFYINRAISRNKNTFHFAYEMTKYHTLPKAAQFDFYFNVIEKNTKKIYNTKEDTSNDLIINTLCEKLVINKNLAKRYLTLMSEEEKIKILNLEGGNNGRTK